MKPSKNPEANPVEFSVLKGRPSWTGVLADVVAWAWLTIMAAIAVLAWIAISIAPGAFYG